MSNGFTKRALKSAIYWHMKGDTNAEIRELYITEVYGLCG